ncbi:MAG: WYL domain-containing protein [Firmicutes bacterium]|nr:WYL domain-containing protein [Bacillota bacterium]
MLADPHNDYTTKQIEKAVSRECPKVSTRMIQKDIKALEEDFGKEMIRNKGGRGTVRYADQASPLFYQELTSDEEEILKEALSSLGQFEGLENFKWLEILKRKLDMPHEQKERPVISFSRNDTLQIPENLLGRLFSAISRKKVIRFGYRRFADKNQPYQQITVYPYQLRQYNNRWFLLCNPIGNAKYPFNPEQIYNYALDRMDGKVEYVEGMPYIDTPVDIDARFDEIVGVTYMKDAKLQDIYFAVSPASVNYIRTKMIHSSQDEVNIETEKDFIRRYPALKGCKFFFISCRPNRELFALFASYGPDVIIIEPTEIREEIRRMLQEAADNYNNLF